jgi:hypothetical protein
LEIGFYLPRRGSILGLLGMTHDHGLFQNLINWIGAIPNMWKDVWSLALLNQLDRIFKPRVPKGIILHQEHVKNVAQRINVNL